MPNYTTTDERGVNYPVFGPAPGPADTGATTGRGGLGLDSSGNGTLLDTAGTARVDLSTSGVDLTGTVAVTGDVTISGTLTTTGATIGGVRSVTGTITSAAAATAVNLIPTASVPTGKKIYVVGFYAKVNGATAWATTATVKIQDNNGTPVDFATMAVAALTGNAFVGPYTSNITVESAMALGTGGTATKGLQLKGDANGTGSDLVVTVLYKIA